MEVYAEIVNALRNAGIYDPGAAGVVLQELGKDRRTKEVVCREPGGEPATDRQKKFLDRIGIIYPRSITKP